MPSEVEQLSPKEIRFEELLPGTMLEGRYRVLERLDEGGIGLVYRALHTKLRREVAVKVLRRKFVKHQSLRPRFEREARALAALTHPNIVAVSDFGMVDDRPYLVMELLDGRTLRQELARGIPTIDRTLDITRQLLRGLAYAHSRGVVHRDIKPGNVFLHDLGAQGNQVKLLDFGFAQILHRWDRPDTPFVSNAEEAFGTPSYMAPEQLSSGQTGPRTDVYGAGVVLYELLTGKKLFRGELDEIVRQHLSAPVPSLASARPELVASDELVAFLERALAKSPHLRFSDASAMLAALDALPSPAATLQASEVLGGIPPAEEEDAEPTPTPARSTGSWARFLALVVVAAASGSLFSWMQQGGWDTIVGAVGSTPAPSSATRSAEPRPDDAVEPRATDPVGPRATDPDPAILQQIAPTGRTAEELRAVEETEPLEERPTEPAVSLPAPAPGPELEPEPSPAGDGFVTEPELVALSAAIDAGRPLTTDEIRTLRQRVADDRDDPAPHIVLARAYDARGWRSDAIDRFVLAWEIDPEVRNSPTMRSALVRLAGHPTVGRRASLVVERIYGRTAIDSVEAAIADPDQTPLERRGLQRLLERLTEL